jgi:hypothetical protein
MKPEHKAVIKTAGPFGLIGAGLLLTVGNPVAWVALAYGTYRVGRAAYRNAKPCATLDPSTKDPNLFV